MSNFVDFDKLYDDFINCPLRERIRSTNFKSDYLEINNYNNKRKEVEIIEGSELDELNHLVNDNKYKPKINFNSLYILGINEDGLKFAQYSNRYIFDELMSIKNFLSIEHKKFDKNLNFLYFIDEKHKFKYLEKAKKKNKQTLYFDDSFGSDILEYINGTKKEILGDKYGVQNCILDNITGNDNLEKKFIIIVSFDVEMFEIYYSIPYTMYEKGSAELEHELVYCCRFDEIEPNEILDYIDKNIENYI